MLRQVQARHEYKQMVDVYYMYILCSYVYYDYAIDDYRAQLALVLALSLSRGTLS
jgi:hypothetical protein